MVVVSERCRDSDSHIVSHLSLHAIDVLNNDWSLRHFSCTLILDRSGGCIVVRQGHVKAEKDEISDRQAVTGEKGSVCSPLS